MIAQTETIEKESGNDTRLGQRWAFALASLALGIASFVHLFGMEKALLAIAFGVLALRPPVARLRNGWARLGIVLGGLSIAAIATGLAFYHGELAALVEHLTRLG